MKILETPLCSLLGIEVPIIQAPVGGAACPALAAAVSEGGGLGMLAVGLREPGEIRSMIRETRKLTSRPFGVNLVLEWSQHERLQACLDEGVKIVSFFWGDPEPYIKKVHSTGGTVMHTVGSAIEAKHSVEKGANIIVAQGWEAGGHVWGKVTTFALVPRVADAVAPVPVIAAGGIADGRGVAAALMLAAAGVWIGTLFLASKEAGAHHLYKEKLIQASETDTAYTNDLFNIGWEAAPHRALRNGTVSQWEQTGCPPAPARPNEGETIAYFADGRGIARYSDVIPLPGMTGEVENLALYAGQGVGLISGIRPAKQIVEQLVFEANETINCFAH